MNNTRDFKGIWIPKEIWLTKKLNITQKILLAEIGSLDNDNGCFATNDYFAEFFNLSKTRISNMITELEKMGLINRRMVYETGTKEVKFRILNIVQDKYLELLKDDVVDPLSYMKHPLSETKHPLSYTKHPLSETVEIEYQLNNTTDNTFTSKGQVPKEPTLLDTELLEEKNTEIKNKVKPAKQPVKQTQMLEVINTFAEKYPRTLNPLMNYWRGRVAQGLNAKQWQTLLDDLETFGGTQQEMVEHINTAFSGGYLTIIPPWIKSKALKGNSGRKGNVRPQTPDNTRSHQKGAYAKEQEPDLALDENGDLIQF